LDSVVAGRPDRADDPVRRAAHRAIGLVEHPGLDAAQRGDPRPGARRIRLAASHPHRRGHFDGHRLRRRSGLVPALGLARERLPSRRAPGVGGHGVNVIVLVLVTLVQAGPRAVRHADRGGVLALSGALVLPFLTWLGGPWLHPLGLTGPLLLSASVLVLVAAVRCPRVPLAAPPAPPGTRPVVGAAAD